MAYCTIEDIQGRITEDDLIRMTDEFGTGLPDTDKIADAIAEAEAEVDSYCAKRHTVPFQSPVPAMIVKVCKDIAVYNVYFLKNAASEKVSDRYQKAVSYLKDVAKGIVDLGGEAAPEIDDGGPAAGKSSDSRTFSLDSMGGF